MIVHIFRPRERKTVAFRFKAYGIYERSFVSCRVPGNGGFYFF